MALAEYEVTVNRTVTRMILSDEDAKVYGDGAKKVSKVDEAKAASETRTKKAAAPANKSGSES